MNLSAPFIDRPVATTLLTLGVALAGVIAFRLLPVSPLPQVDFPTISVQASLPGASPETMAATVAMPLERSLGRIAGVTEITSSSSLGSTRVTLQFDLSRDIDGAARDVQAAINAARNLLPTGLPSNPTYRKVNPADAPIMILALTSDTMTQGQMYDAASTIIAQKLSQVAGVGQVSVGGSSLPAVRVELNPESLNKYGVGLEDVRDRAGCRQCQSTQRHGRGWRPALADLRQRPGQVGRGISCRSLSPTAMARPCNCPMSRKSSTRCRTCATPEWPTVKPSVLVIVNRQPNANIIETVDRVTALLPSLRASIPGAITLTPAMERTTTIRASLARHRSCAGHIDRAGDPGRVRLPAQRPRNADPQRRRAGFPHRHVRCDVPARLLDQQFHADGAHHCHRFRRRRCHRGAGEHVAAHRERHAALRRRVEGRGRSRIHGPCDEHFADRRIHTDPADGRHRRAAVSRICGHPVGGDPDIAGRVADDRADDVRAPAAPDS